MYSQHQQGNTGGFYTLQMRSTGLPELTCVEDTDYIKTVLVLGKSEVEAEASFRNTVIQSCLDLKWTVQAMWWLHKAKHGKRS